MELPSILASLAPAGGGVSFGAEVLVPGPIAWEYVVPDPWVSVALLI